ncbi:MAG: hypothetical protein ABS62_12005 [Microbacterium sp. SCN 70-200]|uniref:oligosaccharide flippase family protein n=1 Tax=unclassified Microbacterium TaxID=2609290 RepID=UPI00086C7107|nr:MULTISPECIES: oligosaccharide flippase family protein [unclassified Microbacterium]MBN9216084.1 oligosaccharide flippase family protein [Microbacterium sp.]ODT39822.1 MAG: hypothetical protein ABS62_12005 [Microbacterium sp. SCN 70-200]OJV80561.1 MAG: hypothetical protein BGO46_01265 [Microbacterium sp. 70-16]
MITLLWAFVERLAPRAGTALLMVIFAATSDPTTVGYYAAMMTGYAILQAITDGAAKRIATAAVATTTGTRFLRTYRVWYPILGTLFLACTLAIVGWWGAPVPDLLAMTPMLALPTIMATSIVPLARLQRAGSWKLISGISGSSAAIALLAGVPLVLWLHNALGSVTQLVLTELLFSIGLHLAAKRTLSPQILIESEESYAAAFASAGGFIISMQAQYQLDRIAVGALGGAGALGAFNLGWSLSRSITDSLSTSTLNVIQSRVMDAREKSADEIREIIMDSLPHAIRVGGVVVAATYVAARFVAPVILDASWDDMLRVVPLMSATAIPSIVCYCLLPALMYFGRMRWAITPRLIGLAFSLGVGWAVQYSLDAAIWFAMARELTAMTIMLIGAAAVVERRMVLLPIIATTVACGGIAVADFALSAMGVL